MFAIGDPTSIKFRNHPGEHKGIANGAITAGALVYTAAAGKLSATQAVGAFLRGIALSDTSADGEFFKYLPIDGETAGT